MMIWLVISRTRNHSLMGNPERCGKIGLIKNLAVSASQ
jgi:hypothetical protein